MTQKQWKGMHFWYLEKIEMQNQPQVPYPRVTTTWSQGREREHEEVNSL